MRLFKVTNEDGSSCNGGALDWPLPTDGKPGKWVKVEGPLETGRNGLHLCRAEDLLSWFGPAVWEAEAGRERVEGGGKIVVRRARLVRRLAWDDRVARLFAADCAERALPIFEAKYPNDDRPRRAIEAARAFANGEIDSAARAAAWAAAWAAARDAAWDAAWDAARAAARDAAWAAAWTAARDTARAAARDAAWDAAWAATREWQNARLIAYLDGEA